MFGMIGNRPSEEEKLLYVIGRLLKDSLMNGRKKLMKMMFFIEHFSIEEDRLVPNNLYSKNEFIIYKFGPFSYDVMNSLIELKKHNLIEEKIINMNVVAELTDEGKRRQNELENMIDNETKEHIQKIEDKFGKKSSKELENLSLEYLGISPKEKESFIGNPVSVIIAEAERV